MVFELNRDGERIKLSLTPHIVERDDAFGNKVKIPIVGIQSSGATGMAERLGPVAALTGAVSETYDVVEATGVAVGQMIVGRRGTEDLGGPIRIAQIAGQAARQGFGIFVVTVAVLSINLGLINLLPVPLLDGGHLLFYAIEAVRGRPLSERAQEWGMRVGLALVGSLMLFSFGNDFVRVIWPLVRGLAA